jgi:hypothetical protein
VVWDNKPVTMTEDQALARESKDNEEGFKVQDAIDWLRELLTKAGPMWQTAVIGRLAQDGICSESTLH